jgi:hypothetical protein
VPTSLPFIVSKEIVAEEYDPVVLSLSRREVKRCLQALEQFIARFGDQLIEQGLEGELVLYEALLYRVMQVPEEAMVDHAKAQRDDRAEERCPGARIQ